MTETLKAWGGHVYGAPNPIDPSKIGVWVTAEWHGRAAALMSLAPRQHETVDVRDVLAENETLRFLLAAWRRAARRSGAELEDGLGGEFDGDYERREEIAEYLRACADGSTGPDVLVIDAGKLREAADFVMGAIELGRYRATPSEQPIPEVSAPRSEPLGP